MNVCDKLHARLGDLWWYSLMIFVACRSGDAIQAFIGLWLVPKYVGTEELGAVLPLQQLSGLFTVPLAVLATVFAKYVNVYATRGEFGKVRSFIRDVFRVSVALFAVCIGAAYLIVPHFYARLNIASGLLTALILAAGFAGNVASLFTSALQGLKMFKTITVQNLVSAPVRLVTLLVAMPVRALSGYVLGQATPPAACSLLAFGSLRRRLAPHPCDPSWRRDLPEILRYLAPVAVYTVLSAILASICTTVYRQRLPEVESAAHYVLTRFAETVSYVGASMMFVLFPLSAEAHERGRETPAALRRTVWATLVVTAAAALLFWGLGGRLLALSPVWRAYAAYADLLPPLAVIMGASVVITATVTYEMACRRFGAAALVLAANAVWAALLVGLAGIGFFRGVLPDAAVSFVESLRVNRLAVFTWASLVSAFLQLALLRLLTRAHR